MATIELDRETITVRLHGLDPLMAMRRTVSVPLAKVKGARACPPETNFEDRVVDGTSGVGVLYRGELAVGSIVLDDGVAFYDVHDPNSPEHALAIDLEGAEFTRIVVDLDEGSPHTVAERINEAVSELRRPTAEV